MALVPYTPRKRARTGTRTNPIVIPDRRPIRRTNIRTGGFLGMESKFLDLAYSATVAATVSGAEADPTGSCLNPVVQGDGESNRDGRKYVITSVYVKGVLSVTGGTSLDDPTVMLTLVQDKQTNGAQLNSEDVLTSPGIAINAMRNLQYIGRFNVLKSMRIDMKPRSAWNGTAFSTSQTPFEMYVKCKIPVFCNGTTGDVSTITDNSIHLIATSTSTAVTLSYNSRIRFQG